MEKEVTWMAVMVAQDGEDVPPAGEGPGGRICK
jgi:hypothetical protein